jgi:hypothetical protein
MNSFEEREKGFEAAFKRDQDLLFRITARRNRLFGLWVAEKLGLSAAEAETYATSVVTADLLISGDDDVIEKVRSDLASKGIDLDAAQLQAELARMAEEARKQITQAPGDTAH